MKKGFLIAVAFMLVIVCGMLMTRVAMAEDCWTLAHKACAMSIPCGGSRCSPGCYHTAIAPYYVDRCTCVASGFSECVDLENINCYLTYQCNTGTATCPTNPTEHLCAKQGGTLTGRTPREGVTGSGCGE